MSGSRCFVSELSQQTAVSYAVMFCVCEQLTFSLSRSHWREQNERSQQRATICPYGFPLAFEYILFIHYFLVVIHHIEAYRQFFPWNEKASSNWVLET